MSHQYIATVLDRFPLGADKTALRTTIPSSFVFTPGQYTILNLGDGEPDIETDARYVSMASAPHEDALLFVMNNGTSEFKKKYARLSSGREVRLIQPSGSLFPSRSENTALVYLAGGVGVTPFRSIVRHQLQTGNKSPLYLFYSDRHQNDSLFLDEFSQFSETNKGFHFIPTFTRDTSQAAGAYTRRIDAKMIKEHVPEPAKARYFIAGSHPYIRGMQQALVSLGVPPAQWSIEVFCGYCPDHVCCCEYVGLVHEDHHQHVGES